jgi:tRNA-dihydrouridine synthase
MDGITDAPFRWITDIYGKPDIIYTEFVSVKGLILGKPAIQRMLIRHQTKTFTVAQFFGCEPEYFYQAAQVALEKEFDGIDINMGCPDKSVFNRGGGAGLILRPELAKEIILSVKKAVEGRIPVSVKTRTGYRNHETKEWISNLLEAEPDLICLHGRTFAQKYSGLAD